jgi:hypothetical protein
VKFLAVAGRSVTGAEPPPSRSLPCDVPYMQEGSPVRSNRDPSPVKQLLSWNAPNQEYKCPPKHYGPRPETAESVRKSYELQIQQRDALREEYAQAESKWPYQPIHHPEARFAYFNGPRYIPLPMQQNKDSP